MASDPSEAPGAPRAARRLLALGPYELMVGLLFVTAGAAAALAPASADTYWHLRVGRVILEEGRVPLVEELSHTAAGRFWPNHEWLWQALSYALFRAGGMPLVNTAVAALVVAAHALAYRLMPGTARVRFWLLAAALPVSAGVWAPRPHIVSLLFVVLLLGWLVRRRWAPIVPLFLVWANVHGGVAMGGMILAAATALALARHRTHARALVLVLAASAAATAATPRGTRLWAFVGGSIARSSEVRIDEWLPMDPTELDGALFFAAALAWLGLASLELRRRRGWDVELPALVALAVLPLAIRFGRNGSIFVLVAAVSAARLLQRDPAAGSPAGGGVPAPAVVRQGGGPARGAALAIVALGAAIAVAWAWSRPLPGLEWRPLPDGAIAALRGCRDKLYNRYDEGGYLLWFVPGKRVYVDSRQDPYPSELVRDHVREENEGVPPERLRARGIACAFLPRASPTAAKLAAGGWRRLFEDGRWVVLEAPP